MTKSYTQLVLSERPKSNITASTFSSKKATLPDSVPDDSVVARVEHISIDPAMRGWLNDARSYIKPVQIGEVMRAGAIGTVYKVGKNVKDLKEGDHVFGTLGWTEYAVVPAKSLEKLSVPKGAKLSDFLGALGMPGQTAYWGMTDVCQIKSGETVVVSGAAGAVGSVACQIAKIRGCKVYGLAGSDEKCKWLEELGVKAINYKSKDFVKQFKDIGYIHCYFDNVGGDILDLALTRLQPHARIALCGAISQYNEQKPKGLQNYLALIGQKAKIQGFIVFDYADRYHEASKEMAQWIGEGKLITKETKLKGDLSKCVEALQGIFEGVNTGKMFVTLQHKDSKL